MNLLLDDRVTACLVVHNEEGNIGRCLKTLRELTHNIIIVHDGPCSDDTIKICSSLGCQVFIRDHVGMCEGHRVWTYFQVKTPWILQIDADEFLSQEMIGNCRNLVDDLDVACYEFLWPYWDGEKYRTQNWPYKKALFQKDKIQYIGFPHEAIRVNGIIKKVPFLIEHRPKYDNYSFSSFFNKHMKWIGVHADYHLMDQSQLDYYPKKSEELIPHYSIIKKIPLLVSPVVFFYHFIGLMVYGGMKEGWYGVRNSFVQAFYYFMLCIEIYKKK